MILLSDGAAFLAGAFLAANAVTGVTGVTGIYLSLQAYDYTTNTVFRFKKMKLEKGSVVTPYSPAPEDVMQKGVKS